MRSVLLLLFLCFLCAQGALPIFRNLANNHGRKVGSCSGYSYLTGSDHNYSQVLGQQYSMVTPENEMKWAATEPSRGSFTYSQGDTIVQYARNAGQVVRGHNLAWGQYNPSWLTSGGFSGATLQSILQNHINNVMGHYKGQLVCWDVVNEAVNDGSPSYPNNYLKSNVWFPAVSNYVDLAFQYARAADPNVKLFYNDYGGEGSGAKSDAIYAMLQSMKQRGIPVDGVGLQYHVSLGYTPSISDVTNNMKRLAALGLEIHITEMDVSLSGGSGSQQQQLAQQATIYQNVLNACLSISQCTSFVTWGFTDKYTWLGSSNQPLPFDTNYQPKPAFTSLTNAVS